jgi:hypothetical protein
MQGLHRPQSSVKRFLEALSYSPEPVPIRVTAFHIFCPPRGDTMPFSHPRMGDSSLTRAHPQGGLGAVWSAAPRPMLAWEVACIMHLRPHCGDLLGCLRPHEGKSGGVYGGRCCSLMTCGRAPARSRARGVVAKWSLPASPGCGELGDGEGRSQPSTYTRKRVR